MQPRPAAGRRRRGRCAGAGRPAGRRATRATSSARRTPGRRPGRSRPRRPSRRGPSRRARTARRTARAPSPAAAAGRPPDHRRGAPGQRRRRRGRPSTNASVPWTTSANQNGRPARPPGEVEREVGRVDVLVAERVEVAGRLAVGAGRRSAGSRYSRAAQSSGANSHLCGSITTESAALDAGEPPGQLGHGQRGAAVGRVDVQPPPRLGAHRRRRRRGRRWRRCWWRRRWPRRRRSPGPATRAEGVAGQAVGVVAGHVDDVEVEQPRRPRAPTSGPTARRRRPGGRRPGCAGATCRGRRRARSGCRPTRPTRSSRPPPREARRAAAASPARRSRRPPRRRPPASSRPRTTSADEGVEQGRRGRRCGRDVGEEPGVVEGDVVRQQHVVDERAAPRRPRARRG